MTESTCSGAQNTCCWHVNMTTHATTPRGMMRTMATNLIGTGTRLSSFYSAYAWSRLPLTTTSHYATHQYEHTLHTTTAPQNYATKCHPLTTLSLSLVNHTTNATTYAIKKLLGMWHSYATNTRGTKLATGADLASTGTRTSNPRSSHAMTMPGTAPTCGTYVRCPTRYPVYNEPYHPIEQLYPPAQELRPSYPKVSYSSEWSPLRHSSTNRNRSTTTTITPTSILYCK